MLIDLLKRIASSSSAFLLETIKKSTSNENDRPATNSKRKLSFETLESRELLAATPFYIEETGMFSLTLIESEAVAQNAVYAYYADDIDGTIDGVTPDKLGTYLAKAQSRLIKQEPLSSSIPAAADQSSGKLNFELSEEFLGKYLAFYTVTTHHDWQDTYNYFFFDSGNVDKSVHFKGDLSSGTASGNLSLEDTPADKNPDWDYNDLVFTTQFVPGIRGSVGNESNNNSNNNNHNGGGGNDDSSCCGSEVCQCFSGNSFDNYDLLNSGDLLVFSDELVGESSNNPFRTIHSDFKLPSAGELPERVVATLQFADLDPITVYYDAQGFVNGDWVTFGIQVDVSSLDSGRYDWTMEIESRFSDGSTTSIIREGTQDVVNWLSNNETGKAWNISDIDRVQITGDGVNWLKGSGDSIWFTLNGDGTYTVEDGSETGTVLTNNNGLIIVTKKDNSKYYFNSAGFIVTKIDSMGNAVTYTYDSSDRLSTITSPDHHTTTYQYNAGGLLSSKTDFAGRSTIYGYDNLGRLVSVTLPDPDGSGELSAPVTTYEYLGNTSLISKITDPAGNTTIYTYNDMKSVIAVTRGDRTETFSGYGAAAVTDLSIAGYDSDHPAAFLAYSNKYGRRTDANGNSVWFSTDIFGNVNREIYSNNYEVEYIRNSSGQVTKKIETAPLGNGVYHVRNTEYLYDNSGNLLQLINPDGGIETWTYDSTFNQVTSYVDQLGRTTLYEIDSNTGLVLSVTEVVGNLDNAINRETDDIVTSYTYTSTPVTMNDPPAGLVETVTDALGFVTQFTYTMCGHVASITEAAGTSFEITAYYEYDSYSRKSAFIDPLGRRTEYLYDNLDNVIQIILPTDPNEPAQFYSYEYNSLNLISKSIDPNGAETTYTYDQDGNILTVGFFDPENTQQQTALILLENIYDANENLIFQYDSLRRFTNYTYNTLNQVTSILSGSLSVLPTVDLRIEYDGFGRVSRESGADGVVVTFVYDMMDRVLEVRRSNDGAILERRNYDAAGQLTDVYDAYSNRTQFVYDSLGRVTQTILPDPDGGGQLVSPVYSQTYDKLSRVTSETDPLGRTTYYEYNALGLLSRVIEPSDDPNNLPTTEYSYNNSGELVQVTLPDGKTANYTYDLLGRVLTTTITGGNDSVTFENSYERFGRTIHETDPLGNITTYVYNNLDQLIEIHSPNPADITSPLIYCYEYDTAGQLINEYDNLGNMTSYEYDYHGLLTQVTLPDPDGVGVQISPIYQYQYDIAGRLTSEIDPLGNGTNYYYDSVGNLTIFELYSASDLTTLSERYEYDILGRQVASYDFAGNMTTFLYDNLGRLIQTTLPDPDDSGELTSPIISYSYDAASQLITTTEPSGKTITYNYNAAGLVTSTIERSSDTFKSVTTTYEYDIVNQLLSTTDGEGRTTTYEYDGLGRLTKTILPDPDGGGILESPVYETVYDASSNVIEEIDPLGNSTIYTYDSRNRVTTTTDANGYTTIYEYNSNDQITALRDASDNTTTFLYDNLNRVISETNELGYSRYYSYNAVGLLTEQVDRNSLTTQYLYNGFYDNTGETWLDQNNQIVREIYFEYDTLGNLTAVNDTDASFTYQYDNLSRLILSTALLTGFVSPVSLNYRYDNSMRLSRTRASFNQDDDFENTYSYNTFGELIGISQFVRNSNTTKSINYTYNQTSQRTSASRYEELQFIAETTYSYDGIGRLNQIEHNGLSEIFANYAMTYDSASRITSINDAIYDYDSTDQLLGAEYDNQADEAYEYDATGNRTNYTIGANNQILSDGVHNYTYDNEGNRTSKINIETGEATIYTWDHRNRLIAVTINTATTSTTVNYRYDYLNRLVSRTVEQLDLPTRQTTQITQHFIHDGNQIILEFEDNELAQRNFWGANVDELVAVDNLIDEETLWVLADHLNSTRNILRNENDTISSISEITYDAFGNIVDGTNPINYGYTGKYFDDITNLQWNINRWYDATTGQWLSEDPIGFYSGDTNLYRYVGNDVTNKIDTKGFVECDNSFFSTAWQTMRAIGQEAKNIGRDVVYSYVDNVDNVQMALDVGGSIPVAGIPADIANGVIHAGRGNYTDAAFCAVGMIPLGGDAIAGTRKAGKAVDKISGVVSQATKHADDAVNASKQTANKGKNIERHHLATNKNQTYTPQMKAIADQYGLTLNENWNTINLIHGGRHTNAYHDEILKRMKQAADEAGNDRSKFLELFEKSVREWVEKNPDVMYK